MRFTIWLLVGAAAAAGCGDDGGGLPDADFTFDTGPVDATRPDTPIPTEDPCRPERMGMTLGMTCDGDGACDDECYCNGLELCEAGTCVAGSEPCADAVACTADSCLEELDRCFHEPMHDMCSDGDACNGDEECDVTTGCRESAPPYCNDEDACTVDSCDTTEGCVYTPRDLDGDGHIDGRCGGDDCDDDPRFGTMIYPGAPEVCDNRRDDDCNGLRDYNDPTCRPTNDACADAVMLPGPGTYSGSTAGLTHNYSLSCGGASGPDAVFRFELTESQDVRISVAGGGSNVTIGLRTWAQCATGPEDKCTVGSPPSMLRRSLPSGEYAIIVKTTGAGAPFDLNLMFGPPTPIPPVDRCTAGTVDVSAGGTFPGMFEEVEDDYALSCHSGSGWRDAAYRFTITDPKDVTITGTTTGGFFSSTFLSLVTDCSMAASTVACLSGNPAMIRRRGLPAGTYYILVEASTTDATSWSLTVDITDPVPRVAGDACSSVIDITPPGAGTMGSGSVPLAMMEFDSGTSCGGTSPTSYRDAYFSFRLTTPRDVTLTTNAGGSFHYMSLGTMCGVFGSDIRCRSGSGALVNTFRSLPAGTYFITVATTLTVGTLNVDITTAPPTPIPPNDRCDGAIMINPTTGYSSTDTLIDFEDDLMGCSSGTPDSFYTFTLASSRRAIISAARTGGMTGTIWLTLRSSCGSPTNIACMSGSPAATINQVLSPGTYVVFVEMSVSALADYSMSVVFLPP